MKNDRVILLEYYELARYAKAAVTGGKQSTYPITVSFGPIKYTGTISADVLLREVVVPHLNASKDALQKVGVQVDCSID